jgi:hypothetical protein
MSKRLGWRFVPALAGLACLLGVAQAEGPRSIQIDMPADGQGRSHVPVPSRGGPIDPEQLFNERLRQAEMFRQLRDQVEKASGKKLDEVLKDLKDRGLDPHSPDFARLLQKHLDRQSGAAPKLNPEDMERLQRLLKDLFPNGIKLPDSHGDPMPRTDPPGKDTPLPDSGNTPDSTGSASRRDPEDREAMEEASQQLAQLARWLDGVSEGMRDSPALRSWLSDVARIVLENNDGRSGGLASSLGRWNQFAKQGKWFSQSWAQLRRFELPSWPSLGLSGTRFSASFSGPGSVGGHGSTQALKWFLAFGIGVLVAVVVWKLLTRYVVWGSATAVDSWRLGPWPVAPATVASRLDLIRAFEYLSLLLLGRQARSWNHREIATRLGSAEAERLATLYEQARYTPEDEPLPEQAVAEFRRDLCLLAGVPGA